MSEKCTALETCEFFKLFSDYEEVIGSGWRVLFCEDAKKSENCERKKHFRRTNQEPPDNMAPSGMLI